MARRAPMAWSCPICLARRSGHSRIFLLLRQTCPARRLFARAQSIASTCPSLARWTPIFRWDFSSLSMHFHRLGQVDDLMSVDTEGHLLLTRQLDDEFQLLAGRMHQLDNHFALDLGNFSEIATQETKAQQVERSR